MSSVDIAPGSRRDAWLALAGLWLVYGAFGAVAASLAPLVPQIRADFGAGNAAMGGVLGAWPLTYIVAAIPCGIFLDRLGVRIGLFVATLVIALSCLLRAMAGSTFELFLAVAVLGIGAPIISVGAPKLIAGLFDGTSRGVAMGVYITGPAIGAVAALSLTNSVLLPVAGTWQGVMLMHAGFTLGAGVVWLILAAVARVPRLHSQSQSYSVQAFIEMLANRQVVILLGVGVGVFFINHALNNWLPELLRHAGMDAVKAGTWASIPTAVGLVASVLLPRFATPERRFAILAALFTGCLLASLLLQLSPGPLLILGLAMMGIARGTMITVALLVLVELPSIPKERLGLAGGVFFAAAEIGGVMGPLVFGILVDATGGFAVALVSVSAISVMLLAMTALLARAVAART
jgi:MFS transporter, CP family, cyanate transporter